MSFSGGQSDSCASVAAVSMSSEKGIQPGIWGLQTSVMVQCTAPVGHLHLMWSCVAASLWLHWIIFGTEGTQQCLAMEKASILGVRL